MPDYLTGRAPTKAEVLGALDRARDFYASLPITTAAELRDCFTAARDFIEREMRDE